MLGLSVSNGGGFDYFADLLGQVVALHSQVGPGLGAYPTVLRLFRPASGPAQALLGVWTTPAKPSPSIRVLYFVWLSTTPTF